MRRYHAKNRKQSNERRKRVYKEMRKDEEWVEKERSRGRDYWDKLRHEAIMAYGGYVCNCCGEKESLFLSLDHINNDGAAHRRQMKKDNYKNAAGSSTYIWLKKNNYPDGFQVLCMNCNFGKSRNNGICPHKSNTHNSVNSGEASR